MTPLTWSNNKDSCCCYYCLLLQLLRCCNCYTALLLLLRYCFCWQGACMLIVFKMLIDVQTHAIVSTMLCLTRHWNVFTRMICVYRYQNDLFPTCLFGTVSFMLMICWWAENVFHYAHFMWRYRPLGGTCFIQLPFIIACFPIRAFHVRITFSGVLPAPRFFSLAAVPAACKKKQETQTHEER